MPPPASTATYSVDDVALRFDVGTRTVLAWIQAGDLRAVNVSRSIRSKKPRWRISGDALAAFEASRTATPSAPRARRKPPTDVIEFY